MGDETENNENTAPAGSDLNLDEISDDPGISKDEGQDFAIGEPMANDVTAIYDIPVNVSAVLGRSTMQVSQLLKLGRGAVIELDRKVGEAIDIYVNNRLVARGEVVVVEDRLGITMTEIVKSDRT
ncbi:MAG: flagellar motor switch protein FliN [Alphaproteobacteria bacterium]|nr:MAG: flagellar motor switch protein FliN [Alphaproteobacteria bacterium]